MKTRIAPETMQIRDKLIKVREYYDYCALCKQEISGLTISSFLMNCQCHKSICNHKRIDEEIHREKEQ